MTKPTRIPFEPLRKRFPGRGGMAELGRALNMSQQRVTNWRRRGVPASALPEVCQKLEMSLVEYYAQAGVRLPPDRESPLDIGILTAALRLFSETIGKREKFSPQVESRVLAYVYDYIRTTGKRPDAPTIRRHLRLVA